MWLMIPLNFIISWFNAWSCGKTWTESRAVGGFPHFMNWMGAIMSASGFTWCYFLIFGFIATQWPITDEETGAVSYLLTTDQVGILYDIGYLVVIFPILGSGIAIGVHSWGVFWRRRSLRNGVTAGWNTYANLHNFYTAIEQVPRSWGNVLDFFGSGTGSDSSSSNDKGKGIIVILAVAAVLAGILTTATIIKYTARKTALDRRFKYELDEDAAQPAA